jgi:fructose-1,6-bisphosphatase/inositol monophosphatase family enzyme
MLICDEAGAVTVDRDGADVVVRDGGTRRPVVASTSLLVEELLAKDEL